MHPEALKSKQREIFEKLKYFKNFYLAGGTALALQIGHRISVDFDLFSPYEIPEKLFDEVQEVFKKKRIKIIVNHSEQLTVMIDKISLSFVRFPFPLLLKLKKYKGVKMLSVPEIGATKAYALGRRATLKDYVDLYFIIKKKYASLKKIVSLAQKKFKEEFEPRLFYEQLIYLEDIEEVPIEYLTKEKPTKKEIQKFFEEQIKNIKI